MPNPLIEKLLAATAVLTALVTGSGAHLVKYKDVNTGKKETVWVGSDNFVAPAVGTSATTCQENNKLKPSGDGEKNKYYTKLNCSTTKKRNLKDVSVVVIHEGGTSADTTAQIWISATEKKRIEKPTYPQIAAHYGIERDGTIHQLLDETLIGVHADSANRYAIGIDLAIPQGCSQSEKSKTFNTCAYYENAQYESLKKLIKNIEKRTSVKFNDDQVVGHCEVCDSTHKDPRGFDWTKIGLTQKTHTMGPDGVGCVKRWSAAGGECAWKPPKKKEEKKSE